MKIFSTRWQVRAFQVSEFNAYHPIGAKLRAHHLVKRISIADIEHQESVELELKATILCKPLPFGLRNKDWEQFKAKVNSRNIWSFRLVDVESEWRTSHWEGYVEKKWLRWGALIVSRKHTKLNRS